jgi:hypothetical protein
MRHLLFAVALLALHAPVAIAGQDTNVSSLPPLLRDLITTAHDGQPDAQRHAAAPFLRSDQAFATQWKAYEARRDEIAPAVAKARELAKKDRPAALRQLLALISEIPESADGTRIRRQWVEPADAEYPACVAVLELAGGAKDFRAYARAAHGLLGRRKVADDRESERMQWFAFRNTRALSSLGGEMEPERKHKVDAIVNEVQKQQDAAIQAARVVWSSTKKLGLKTCRDDGLKVGDWCADDVPNIEVHGRTATYRLDLAFAQPYDCRQTDRIEAIDPVTGQVRYEEQCKYRPRQIHEQIEANLAEDAPSWIAKGTTTWILGRVTKTSPHPMLADAVLPDLRFASVQMLMAARWEVAEWEGLDPNGEVAVMRAGPGAN